MKVSLLAVALCLATCISLSACGESSGSENNSGETTPATTSEMVKTPPKTVETPDNTPQNDDFFDFVSMFPDQMTPFSSEDIEFSSNIDSSWVSAYLNPTYGALRDQELEESQSSEEAEEEYYPLYYVYGGRAILPHDFYCVIWYGQREGIGPAESLGITTFTEDGKRLSEILLDASEVLTSKSVQFTVESETIIITGGESAGTWSFSADGTLTKE